jgi:dipeptidyl aminopeptidase/acylaminoacyl peptidase
MWNPDGTKLLVQARSQDNKDRWFAILTPSAVEPDDSSEPGAAGEDTPESPRLTVDVELIAHDRDDAWIGWSVAGGYGWMPDGESIYFVSERDGTMHLYSVRAGGGEPVALTTGDYEVFSPRLTRDRSAFIFEASIPSPFEVQAYRLPVGGGEPEQLTSGLGRMDVTLSPDGEWIAGVGSKGNQPWELYVKRATVAGPGERITDSASPAFKSYDWLDPEVIHFTAADGTQVPARLYKPARPHPQRPAVIFVHGAGYLHNVHHYWSSYSREYTFHHLLMERGYTVLDIDYRGSAGYGRDWRTAIYRYMGDKDLSDQVDGARYLVEEHGVAADRIGLYGGSYGGFITLMAMFTAPETFKAGAALRPVTDWAAYNHGYTSNILNTPVDDPEAYTRSSPIYFAENLAGALLICHGLVDTNVHAQDTIRLAQRLIELRKDNWEVALYPVENHGFRQSSSWYDEYRRILKLFEGNLKD